MLSGADVSIVVPTLSGRAHWLERCLAAYAATAPDAEVIVVRDRPSCGTGWRDGAARSRRAFVHFTADDIEPHLGWLEAALDVAARGAVPVAHVVGPDGRDARCPAPLGDLGYLRNVLVPFLPNDGCLFDWLLPSHYGTDDWVTYLAASRGVTMKEHPGYRFTHYVAPEGRDYSRRFSDVRLLCERMEAEGYLPPAYQKTRQGLKVAAVIEAERLRR